MPLWKLQTVGSEPLEFLYENRGRGANVKLKPGVAYCLRRFHGLISELVRSAWIRYVRRTNVTVIGGSADLAEFMFGTKRADLKAFEPILRELQRDQCFYCPRGFQKEVHVDHFIPRSLFALDLGHNFVLAHATCNSAKSDHIAAAEHLEKWVDRNIHYRDQLAAAFDARQILHDLTTVGRVAQWTYGNTQATGGLTWLYQDQMVPLAPDWQSKLSRMIPDPLR